MARITMVFLALLLVASPQAALAQSEAAAESASAHTLREFTAWKLEAYRRRDVAGGFGLQDSAFQDSLLGYRVAAVNGSSHLAAARLGYWSRCPAGHRNGSLLVNIELPQEHPTSISLEFFNRDNLSICETQVIRLHAGRMDIEVPLDGLGDPSLDSNPVSILLRIHGESAPGNITALRLKGYCENFGEHLFADLDLQDYGFLPGQAVILR